MEFALKQGRVLVLDAAEAKERWESASFWNEMEYMLQSNRMHFFESCSSCGRCGGRNYVASGRSI